MTRRVLVTGASGAIGSRLVEKLVFRRVAPVRALVRSHRGVARVARLDVDLVWGDLAKPADVERAIAGCDVVFHCAYDFADHAANLTAALNLAHACLRHGVDRLVVVSSLAVYQPLPDGVVDETSPRERSGWPYGDTKLAIEQELERLRDGDGLPLVLLEPTVVYGPHASWTTAAIRRVRRGRVVLPNDGGGLAHVVYVDDVVEALLLAADTPAATGARVLVSGPEPVTWRQYYGAYERMLGVESVVVVPRERIPSGGDLPPDGTVAPRRDPSSALRKAAAGARRLAGPLVSDELAARLASVLPRPLVWPDAQALALYGSRSELRLDRAHAALGYTPRVSFAQGIDLTARYVAWAEL
jgi:nucleoside-diphosphate-sugar epimerase